MRKQKSKVVGLKVETADPLDMYEPSVLATDLAMALQGISNYQADADAFAKRANVDRTKASALRELAEEVRERKKNGRPAKVSRMDPLDSYDAEAIETQARQHDANAVMFDQKASKAREDTEKSRKESDRLQRLLAKVNKRRKEKLANS
jgi:hypothetical protein